jgi:hypothetical protein
VHPVADFCTVVIKADGVERDNACKFLVIPNAKLDYKRKLSTNFKRDWNTLNVIQGVSHGVFGRNGGESGD